MRGESHVDCASLSDPVLIREDGTALYTLPSVVDDGEMGVTHVVRGEDLFAATGIHRLLQELLGFPQPTYFHHWLVTDREGRKLSKSEQATGLNALRAAGVTPEEIKEMVGL